MSDATKERIDKLKNATEFMYEHYPVAYFDLHERRTASLANVVQIMSDYADQREREVNQDAKS